MNNNIILLFGGDSCERDISIITAVQLYENIDKTRYNIYPIYIFESHMYLIKTMKIDTFMNYKAIKSDEVYLRYHSLSLKNSIGFYKSIKINSAVLATHGGLGENGALQGYLELCDIPYTSCGVMPSALLMDKVMTKRLLSSLNIPYIDYIVVKSVNIDYANIVNQLGTHLIVKPASLGSSIGIKIVDSEKALLDAIEVALCYDSVVIVERALENFREYNIAIVRCEGKTILSDIESPVVSSGMLRFDDKYLSSGKMNGGYREFPAKVDESIESRLKEYTRKVYDTLGMKGVARFDYLVEGDEVYLNEVNTIPGSLAYYLFEENGINYTALIDMMIDEAMREWENNSKLITSYKSSVLKTAKNAVNKLRK